MDYLVVLPTRNYVEHVDNEYHICKQAYWLQIEIRYFKIQNSNFAPATAAGR